MIMMHDAKLNTHNSDFRSISETLKQTNKRNIKLSRQKLKTIHRKG